MSLARRNQNSDLFGLHNEMNNLFDRFFSPEMADNSTLSTGNWLPSMDVIESDNGYTLNLDLPGLTKKDINVTVENNVLKIEGERKREDGKDGTNYHRVERRYGKFFRAFRLPKLVKQESIEAGFKNGILSIEIPKAEEVKPKSIEVKIA